MAAEPTPPSSPDHLIVIGASAGGLAPRHAHERALRAAAEAEAASTHELRRLHERERRVHERAEQLQREALALQHEHEDHLRAPDAG